MEQPETEIMRQNDASIGPVYGDLSEQAYIELLNEIEDDDIDLEAEAAKINEVIAKEDAEDSATGTSGNAPKDVTTASAKAKATGYKFYYDSWRAPAEIVQARRAITREAFNQDKVSLSDTIPPYELTELIKILTKSRTKTVKRYEALANKRLTQLLRPFIPKSLRCCFYKYPNSVPRCPGFLYIASEEYGGGTQLWARPDIPYYIKQGTEHELLRRENPNMLYTVDKYVFFYNERRQELRKKEIKYASVLINKKINSYYSLLKLNPFWFNKLYIYKFNESLIELDNEF